MNRMQKHNLYNIKRNFEKKTGTRLIPRYAASERQPAPQRKVFRPAVLVAILSVLCLTLVAFTWPLFSPLDGDALTLSATYEGNGIVKIQVENRSHKELEFQPQTKLVKWITGEEVSQLTSDITFDDLSIKPYSTETITLNLSNAYDMELLEQSLVTEWYYLVLTNNNFVFGQEWKCSVYFGNQTLDEQPTAEKLYSLDPVIIEQIEEELRFYFEDDYTGILAANPMNYEYLQKVQELVLRCGKRIVPSVSASLMMAPAPDEMMFNEETQRYEMPGQQITVQDAFGKLVGTTEEEHIKYLCYHMPCEEGETDGWCLPLLYYSTFEVSTIESMDDCALIHGQIVSFAELEQYKVFQDEQFVCYDVTHLFYSDLREYVETVLKYREATDQRYYFDEQVFSGIQLVYDYYKENLRMVTWEEFTQLRGNCNLRYDFTASELVENGLSGEIISDLEILKVVISITDESGSEVYSGDFVPDSTHSKWSNYGWDLSKATEVNEVIDGLAEGVYTIDFSVLLDTEYLSYRSLMSMMFTTGDAQIPAP